MTRIAVFGIGEAGSLIAADLVAAGVEVRAFDPAGVPTPSGVSRFAAPQEAVAGADIVLGITAMADASTALQQALADIPEQALYADLSTSAPAFKRQLAAIAAGRRLAFADVALMSPVPGKGLRTPALVSGDGAARFVAVLSALGMPLTDVGLKAGDAATRKLLRSIFLKGLAGLAIEAMEAGEKAGLGDWLWEHLSEVMDNADAGLLSRMVQGTGQHALRRLHEMEATQSLLEDLDVPPVMTRGTVENLQRVLGEGLPPGARGR